MGTEFASAEKEKIQIIRNHGNQIMNNYLIFEISICTE
jgi:hypothetical protein